MQALAKDIMDYLNKKELWYEVAIYVCGERWKSDGYAKKDGSEVKKRTKSGTAYYIEKDIDVTRYLEFCNPKTISIIFEGPLYHLINYRDFGFIEKLDKKFLDKFGLFFEMGDAWNMSAYSIF